MSAASTDPPAGVAASAGPAEPGPAFADALFDALGAVALVIDVHGRIVRMNRAAEQLSGHASEQACGEPFYWTRFIPPEERVQVRGWFEAMRSRSIEPEATNHWIGADGRLHLLRWSNTILDDANGEPAYLIAVGTDISEQVRLTRLSSRLAAYRSFLAQVSQAMARAESDTELLRVVCDLAVRHAGVRLAWVGVPDASSRMQVVGGAGPALGYLDGIDVSVDPQQVSGQGSAGRCWREARAYFNLSFSADPMLHAWRERGEAHGLQASAVLPIRRGRAMLAVLLLYSDEPDYFDAALQELLLELVDDIERGLDHLQLRQMNKVLVDHTDAAVAVVRRGVACSPIRAWRSCSVIPTRRSWWACRCARPSPTTRYGNARQRWSPMRAICACRRCRCAGATARCFAATSSACAWMRSVRCGRRWMSARASRSVCSRSSCSACTGPC